jgi:EAL domain-containing protein (putative c-di-GMP-specific phosphodiesterase class I)
MNIEDTLRNSRLVPYYMAITDHEKNLKHYEILTRWRDPLTHQDSLDESFFSKLNDRYTHHITTLLIRKIILDLKNWSTPNVPDINFNLSLKQLAYPDITKLILHLTHQTCLTVQQIAIEVTEEAVHLSPTIRDNLNELRDVGFSIVADDLGSNLNDIESRRMSGFRYDSIKLDRSVINTLETNTFILEHVKRYRDMNLPVIAEGIEDLSVIPLLVSLGVTHFQGYALGTPKDKEHLSSNHETFELFL